MGYNVKICEKKVERIQKEILKQKKLIVDLNVKIRKLKKELKPRKLKGGGDSESQQTEPRDRLRLFEDGMEIIHGVNFEILSNFGKLRSLTFNDDENFLKTKMPLILKNVKLDIQKTCNKYDPKNFIDIMVFVNYSIQKLTKEQKIKEAATTTIIPKVKISNRVPIFVFRVEAALDLLEYYIQHNMNARLEMFNTLFEKIKSKQLSMFSFITYIIENTDCYIIEDYELGNIIIQAATKHDRYYIIDKMIEYKRYFDVVECMKSIVENSTNKNKEKTLKHLSEILKKHSLFENKYNLISKDLHKSQQEDFDACIDILLLDEELKINNNISSNFKETYEKLLIDNLKIAAEKKNITKFSNIFNKFTSTKIIDDSIIEILIKFVAYKGLLDILKIIILKSKVKLDSYICNYAAAGGHMDMLEWLRENSCPWDENTCSAAAAGGHLKVLEWLREQGCPWDEDIWNDAATGGNYDILLWLSKNNKDTSLPNNIDVETVVFNGYFNIVKWLTEHNYVWDENTCTNAAAGGHLEMLKWLRAHNCPWDKDTCTAAAGYNQLEVLKWARSKGCEWNEETCEEAASGGHLNVLQWAHANGCPWDSRTCTAAAENGHLPTLMWANANGCIANKTNIIKHIGSNELIILRWMIKGNIISDYETPYDDTRFRYNRYKDVLTKRYTTEHLYPYVVKWFIDNNIIDDISEEEILENKTYNIDTQLRVKKLLSKTP